MCSILAENQVLRLRQQFYAPPIPNTVELMLALLSREMRSAKTTMTCSTVRENITDRSIIMTSPALPMVNAKYTSFSLTSRQPRAGIVLYRVSSVLV